MFKRKEKAFTLIELIATLVIMAIIALIVTPLVMNIIRSARTSADKRSIDAYGRSIELAIAGYLMDNGSFPTSIEQLTIEYSGDQVTCSTTQLNTDSSVYLAGCTVGGRSVENYTYGTDKSPTYTAYTVGDEVTYNNVDYYVIKDSGVKESTVTLLKAEPLSVAEVNQFGAGHVNRYTPDSVGTANDVNGYGGMAYYSSETCGKVNNNWVETGCKTDYASSEVKYVVDAWKIVQAPAAIDATLIAFDNLVDDLGFEYYEEGSSIGYRKTESTPSWLYNSNYWYWTISPNNDSMSSVWIVPDSGYLQFTSVNYHYSPGYKGIVRPVIVLPKSALSS